MAKPFVSVLIDTYNHERFIEEAIVSVLEQDFPASEREIIVVDDGSTDRTPEIVRKFEPRVRLLRKENGGQASAFNAGIPECKGEIVSFLDGDDWWAPAKLSRVAPVFARSPEVGMVGHGTMTVFADGEEHTEILRVGHRFSLQTVEGARMFRSRKSFLGTRSTIRASILAKLLPVPETIRIEADEFVFTMAAALGEVEILPEALFFYRLHSANFYSQDGFDEKSVKRKQQSIAELAKNLDLRLKELGTSEAVVRTVVDAVWVEADQLRLSTEGGAPWETVRTELAMYHLLNSDAPWSHRVFKYATVLPAYLFSPRFYYRVRRDLANSRWYVNVRKILFPVPQPGHLKRSLKPAAQKRDVR
jgi:glycosyltransferase involved in cell wall biosynthesis